MNHKIVNNLIPMVVDKQQMEKEHLIFIQDY